MTPKPQNGHVLFVRCQDPANTSTGKIQLANLGKKGIIIGKVLAVDESPIFDNNGNSKPRPHICQPNDVIYVRDQELTGALKLDGGDDAFTVRESLVFMTVSDAGAEALTSSQVDELKRQIAEQNEVAQRMAEQQQNAAIGRGLQLVQG